MECTYISECKLKDILKEGSDNPMCQNTVDRPSFCLPIGPGPDSFLDVEYCPAYIMYENEKTGELITKGPIFQD